jgi:hypothetical protein
MRRAVVATAALGAACAVAAVVCGVLGIRLYADGMRISNAAAAPSDEADGLFRAGYALDQVTMVVAGGALLALVAVLALLARWWQLRPARAR